MTETTPQLTVRPDDNQALWSHVEKCVRMIFSTAKILQQITGKHGYLCSVQKHTLIVKEDQMIFLFLSIVILWTFH